MRRFSRISLLAGAVGVASFWQASDLVFAQTENAAKSSPLVTVPQTPEEQVDAALLLLKLSRADLAKEQIQAIVGANLDADTLIQLRDKFGTGVFLRLARNADLQPLGGELLEQISAAAQTQSSAQGYLDDLLAGMDGNREDAQASIREIKRLGPNAVIELVSRAGGDAASEYRLERVLSLLGDRAVAPLADVVAVSTKTSERFLALRVLARTAGVEQIPTLVAVGGNAAEDYELRSEAINGLDRLSAKGLTFDPAGVLKRSARELLSGQQRIPRDNDGLPLVYGFDAGDPALAQTIKRLDFAEPDARRVLALRLLEWGIQIDPDDRESMRMAYVLRLESTGDQAAKTELLRRGPAASEDVLSLALELSQNKAAVAALETLALAGRRDSFAANGPAARALVSPSPAVQFAAARAAVMVEPGQAFPNSPRVVQILDSTLAGNSDRKVVVVDPNIRRAGDIGGRLQQIGFTPIVTSSGREGFRTAAARGDVVLAVVHANSVDWELTPTVANFAADARTASIPMAVVASTQARDSLNWIRQRHPGLMYVPVQSDTVGMREALKPALAQMENMPLPTAPETRAEAIDLLRRIAERGLSNIFSLTDTAETLEGVAFEGNEELAVNAIAVLSHVGRPESQSAMVKLIANSPSTKVRIAAGEGLVRNMTRFGSAITDELAVQLAKTDAAGDSQLEQLIAAALGIAGR